MSGHIYCAINEIYPDYVKVGCTINIDSRMSNLSSSHINNFKCVFYIEVDQLKIYNIERGIHNDISNAGYERVKGKEFFKCKPEDIKHIFNKYSNKKIEIIDNIKDIKEIVDIDCTKKLSKHTCEICNYETNNKSNYTRHLKSEIHIKNITPEDKFCCNNCFNFYSSKSSLNRHKKTCGNKNISNDVIIISNNDDNKIENNIVIENLLLKQKIEFLEEKKNLETKLLKVENKLLKESNEKETTLLKQHKKEISHTKDKQIELLQQEYIGKSRGIETNNMNAITFASIYYNKTLKMNRVNMKAKYIDNGIRELQDIKILIKEKPELSEQYIAEKLIFLYSNKTLVNFICNVIKDIYKTEKSMDQTFWSSDVSRLIYIIRTTIKNKNIWIYDKKGIKIKELIIDPLLNEIINILTNYITKIKEVVLINNAEVIINELKNKLSFRNQIIKELAPIFYLDRNIK